MLTQPPHMVQKGFTFTELLSGLVICDAPTEDPHGWGNAHADEPAFLVYLGYNIPQEREESIARLRLIWGICGEIVYRPSQRVPGYWHEIKIRGMQRYSDVRFVLSKLSNQRMRGFC